MREEEGVEEAAPAPCSFCALTASRQSRLYQSLPRRPLGENTQALSLHQTPRRQSPASSTTGSYKKRAIRHPTGASPARQRAGPDTGWFRRKSTKKKDSTVSNMLPLREVILSKPHRGRRGTPGQFSVVLAVQCRCAPLGPGTFNLSLMVTCRSR